MEERNISDIDSLDSADGIIILVFLNTENGFGLVVDFGSDVSSSVSITLVLVDDCVEMKIEFLRPIHQIVDYEGCFSGIVDVKHQVSDAVDDYKPDSWVFRILWSIIPMRSSTEYLRRAKYFILSLIS